MKRYDTTPPVAASPGPPPSLQWQVLPWRSVPGEWLPRWEEVRGNQLRFLPPFFSPQFAEAVERSRGDVWLAVGRRVESGPIVAFFPFHRVGRACSIGVPVGRFLNDAHDVLRPDGLEIDWMELAEACQVNAWDLHALPLPSPELTHRHRIRLVRSFSVDLTHDSEAFLRQLQREHRTLAKQPQKSRKMAREVGTLRLEVDCRQADLLRLAIEWKRQQYRRTHILDLFLPEWTQHLVRDLHQSLQYGDGQGTLLGQTATRGLLSVLLAGKEVVAMHVGMIERGRLHYWFPAYDPGYARYSPGTALYAELIRAGTSAGIHRIDMGYGEQPYKHRQTSQTNLYGQGRLTDSRRLRWQHEIAIGSHAFARRLPMKQLAKRVWRAFRPQAGIGKLR